MTEHVADLIAIIGLSIFALGMVITFISFIVHLYVTMN